MKSRFFANISHEFRTPLTLILGPIEKLLSKAVDSESKSELSMMQRNAKRLQRLINQLLDLSKLESGGMTIQVSEVNIVELVYSYVQSFESLAKRKRINLKFNAKEDSIIAFVDKDKIEKILNNLLSNAFKFTNEGGKISVGVGIEHPPQSPLDRGEALIFPLKKGDKGGCINITISDTGIGIPPSRIEKIFDRFYQMDDSQKREHEGTGIGLALTKELVELHHGQITAESEVGKGTTFSISLPLGRDHFKGIEIVDDQLDTDLTTVKEKEQFPIEETFTEYADYSDQFLESKTGKSIILIIEDNPDMRGYIHGYLDKDYKIIEAEDGQQGFDKAIETIPDLIISDVMMPGMDGFELCEKLKTDERTSHIPVILLTARAESDDRIEGLQTGADDYLIKPFDSKELLVRINNLIEQRQKLKERFNKELILGLNDFTAVSIDEKFISRLIDICHKHLTDSNFSVESLSHEASLSRTQLHRKLKGLTGQSATEFIKTLRLKRAALLLREGRENISQIAYEVGFNNLSYFARSFKELFGQTPSEYLNSKENR
jgi:DNA-binding response OmpR family regulator/two-component sensor histidine kinase